MKLKKGKFLGAIVLSLFLLSSCKTLRHNSTLFISKTDQITDTLKTVYSVNSQGDTELVHRIKPGDIVAIQNLQNLEFGVQQNPTSGTGPSFQVGIDGTVTLPAVGKVPIAGLTRREASQKLQELFGQKLLKDPIIELYITSLKVNVLGEVRVQGKYLLEKDNTTLIDIIGEAGGLTEIADPKNIKIIRGDRANPELIYINLKDINSLGNPKLVLQNNDIVYIEKRSSSQETIRNSMNIIQPVVLLLNVVTLLYSLR